MARSLAPHLHRLRLVGPQGAAGRGLRSSLPHLAACRCLRSLTICHATPAALDDGLAPLDALTALHVTVHWEAAGSGWLDFVAHLTSLQVRVNPGAVCLIVGTSCPKPIVQ